MKLTLTSAPASEPISLDEARMHLRVTTTDENSLIDRLITAARRYCESACGGAFVTQTWKLTLDEFPDGEIRIPRPPLTSVTSIAYYDEGGTLQTLDPLAYQVDAGSDDIGRVVPGPDDEWPATQIGRINAVEITFVAGVAAASVDTRAKQAILLLVGHWYQNREGILSGTISKEIEIAVHALMNQMWHGGLGVLNDG